MDRPKKENLSEHEVESCNADENNQNTELDAISKPGNDNPTPKPTASAGSSVPEAQFLEVDPNDARRKRQRTNSPNIEEIILAKDNVQNVDGVGNEAGGDMRLEAVEGNEKGLKPDHIVAKDHEAVTEVKDLQPPGQTSSTGSQRLIEAPSSPRPKKMLLLNTKTGTIGSPPKNNAPQHNAAKKPPPRSKKQKSFMVTIRYGDGQRLPGTFGMRINQILEGVQKGAVPEKLKSETNSTRKVASSTPTAKATHPFFLGKSALKAPTISKSIDDPTKSDTANIHPPTNAEKLPHSSTKSAGPFLVFGGTRKTTKYPGSLEPAWPWQGMIHIRGYQPPERPVPDGETSESLSDIKKSKYQAVEVLAGENILNTFATKTDIDSLVEATRHVDTDTFELPSDCLRLPIKHFESGRALQQRVGKLLRAGLPNLSASYDSPSEDELQITRPPRPTAHSALSRLFGSVASSLSAFDRCECETQSWVQKYAPKCASEVLQSGKEALILKDWLQRLTVTSVDTGSADKPSSQSSLSSKRSGAPKAEKPAKRKRKCKDLEGFIISSDEEENYMDEISDPEDPDPLLGGEGAQRKTVIRAGDVMARGSKDSMRLTNAVVVSGPHGCGKTAAVYAVAKELGFEVFEISPNSRRSGKDVIEKVGDMTRNHLVQRSNDGTHRPLEDHDSKRLPDTLEEDIISGRQGTMNSFFKKKEQTAPKPKSSAPEGDDKDKKSTKQPKQPKQQKQSLILLEEVDILYEEDKQFWATIISLISQSKRPIIMTCNNESAVPFQSLSLHAIIRFNPPPIDLAVDYMLLLAANEGHLLQRKAVEALYDSRRMDLRAAITELNFWCQFAVGDRKGGLDWYYPRWPRGSDVDSNGDTVRVVSEGTYQAGMGWFCEDFRHTGQNSEAERMCEVLEGWDMDVGDWHDSLNLESWARSAPSRPHSDPRSNLNMYDDFIQTMSDSDILSGPYFAPENKELLDVSLPPISSKSREDYILAYGLLEASPKVVYDDIRMDMSIWMKSQARETLKEQQCSLGDEDIAKNLAALDDERIMEVIRARSKSSPSDSFLSRRDFSLAFDPISEPEKTSLHTTGNLESSSFDRTFDIITLDLAPYVRSIVSCDMRLQRERHRLSNLLSEGGTRGKRMRTTRAAMSALEGGTRSTTRRERYFGPELNPHLVLRTGEPSWLDASLLEAKQEQHDGSRRSSITEGSTVGEHSEA